MPKVKSDKKSETGVEETKPTSGWQGGQLFGSEANENTFQGAGFKDKEKALETLRLLDGRDVTYQFQIINSMYNRAKVILKRTTDKEKRQNLTESVETFESWLDEYRSHSRAKENFSYLPIETVESYKLLADHYGIKDEGFLGAYKEADGDLKKLRVKKVPGKEITWDIERNNNLKPIATKMKDDYISLYETDEPLRGLPTKEHVQLIMWGYSSEVTKVKKCIPLIAEKVGQQKE